MIEESNNLKSAVTAMRQLNYDELQNLKISIKVSEILLKNRLDFDIPLEIGKTYKLKMNVSSHLKITKIVGTTIWGIYIESPHLGECPLLDGAKRLIHLAEDRWAIPPCKP